MATVKTREKRRVARRRKNEVALLKSQEPDEILVEDDEDDEEDYDGVDLEDEDEPVDEKSLINKDYGMDMPTMGATSWEELDAQAKLREQADQMREVTYSVQELVSNICYSSLSPKEKANAIKKVGDGLSARISETDNVEKSLDMDLLELKVLIAKDARHTPMLEKIGDWISKKRWNVPDNTAKLFYIQDKAHVRQALHLAVEMIEKGGDGEIVAKDALSKIKDAAKQFGIGSADNMTSAVIVEKDKSGQWRAVMWPSNNFKDLDGDIISESAHKEYVDWVNKNMDVSPVFLCHHIPGTRRENRVDFVGYESGFLLMSAPLTEKEAAGLLRAQLETDLGMSHGTFVLSRNGIDKRVIEKYRMVEVSDLPLDHAANPFTDFETLRKEAVMDTRQYLVSVLGSEEEADKHLKKMDLKQKELRQAGIEEKEKSSKTTPEAEPEAKAKVQTPAPITNIDLIVEAVKKELDVDGLEEFLSKLKEDSEKVPVLEALIMELTRNQDEVLAEKIAAPVEKALIWQKARASQSEKNILNKDDEEDKKLSKAKPVVHWLNQMTNTDAIAT